MKRILLGIGGIANLVFVFFHVYLFFRIAGSAELSAPAKELIYIFNLAGTLMIAFFAYASLCCARQILESHLGKATIVFIALVYLSRGAMEIVLGRWEWLFLVACAILGLLYSTLLFPLGGEKNDRAIADLDTAP